MFCNQCGVQVSDDSRFCLKCGSAIANVGEIATVSQNTSMMSKEERMTMVKQLKSLSSNLGSLDQCIEKIEQATKQLNARPVRKLTVSKFRAARPFAIPGLAALGIGFYLTLMLAMANSNVAFGIIIMLVGVAFLGYAGATCNSRQESQQAALDKRYEDSLIRQADAQKEIEAMCQKRDSIIAKIQESMFGIPEQYFYEDALTFFADRLLSGRSNSLPEAMDAYDEHLHRLKLEDAAMAQAEYARQNARNLSAIKTATTINTVANVANVIHHW